MSNHNNARAKLLIYVVDELLAESTCKQDLQVQLEAIERLSMKGRNDVA